MSRAAAAVPAGVDSTDKEEDNDRSFIAMNVNGSCLVVYKHIKLLVVLRRFY